MNSTELYRSNQRKKRIVILVLLVMMFLFFLLSCLIGTGSMTIGESFRGFFRMGTKMQNRIVWSIRMPRAIAAVIAGFGLGLSGLMMQTNLRNPLASPSTMGVSNAAVFGANLAIIAFGSNEALSSNPYFITGFAFVFAIGATAVILLLAQIKGFAPQTVILAGVGIGTLFTAGTTLLQYFAVDINLSEAVYWTFGDLGRASYQDDLIMLVVVTFSALCFFFLSYQYDALLSGDDIASSLGVNVRFVRFFSLLLASLITATCISFLGIIGFIGIIAPHIMKRIVGMNHRYLVPCTALFGSVVLLFTDIISRVIVRGSSLPVGAVTSIIGVPVFLYVIFARKEGKSLC